MTPAHDELCHAIVVLGSEACAMADVRRRRFIAWQNWGWRNMNRPAGHSRMQV
jgi:hypothetical protein